MKEIEEGLEKVNKLVEHFGRSRKDKILSLLNQLGELYFSAPASSQEKYHYSFPGGLALHSVNVFKNLYALNETFKLNLEPETVLIVSLFHDLGKCVSTNLKDPHYLPQDEKWRQERGQNYKFNESCLYLTNHQRTMYILHHFNFPLSAEEYQAILLNDGAYLDENKPYRMKECKLALFLHIADRVAAFTESNQNSK